MRGSRTAGIWWHVAQDIVQRADAALGERYGRLLMPLAAAMARVPGGLDSPPDWVDPAALAKLLDDGEAPLLCWLVRAASGSLRLQAKPPDGGASPLGDPLLLDAGGAQLEVGNGAAVRRRWLSRSDLPVALAPLNEPAPLSLVTAREMITIVSAKRPRGISGWRCHLSGISVDSPPLGDLKAHWGDERLRVVAPNDKFEDRSWALEADGQETGVGGKVSARFGIDAEHGLYADVRIQASHETVEQRLRWIEPGTFLMGSPEDEPERHNDEGPRHAVTLTRGFWLADTACTQALWQAVMGRNLSDFTGDPQRPVEQVSWHDVGEFLRKLEALLPGCQADLPTEAEWEYARRAGTETPFSFGPQITPEQVNYIGDLPYAGGEKGLYRGKTVPVKSLPPNAWGLYEMHGNVWEWCVDSPRTYDGKPQQDPAGPVLEDKQARRAVRGGSWNGGARGSRSAYRSAIRPGDAHRGLGFRLCLRSIESGQVSGRPGGPAQSATGGSPSREAPAPEEAGGARGLRRLLPDWLRPGRNKKE